VQFPDIGQTVNNKRNREKRMSMHEPLAKQDRYRAADLITLASALLQRAGHMRERADIVADTLVEGDLMGHTTHGLQLLPLYLDATARGALVTSGHYSVVSDRQSAVTWDGNWLAGPWLMREALNLAFDRIGDNPVMTIIIRRAGHIGCLAAYPRRATERNLMMLLSCSDPSVAIVAPHGAVEGRFTPNPIAAGWPAAGAPVILDICPSTTTNGLVARMARTGERVPGPWLIDRDGNATDDPHVVMTAKPAGAIMPLGGKDLGHKGFALGLLGEAITAGLAGFGRADGTDHWGATIFIQVIDPQAFGGIDPFRREMGHLAQSCRSAAVPPGAPAVRMPGERALQLREQQLREGVVLHPEIWPALLKRAEQFSIEMPKPIGAG
jgi:LDH2 family malate/lactate/ureidoglycolate dehydrogenase